MGWLTIKEVYSYSEYVEGVYKADDGEEYDVALSKNYDHNSQSERREVVNVEKSGFKVPETDPIWKEVEIAFSNLSG